MCQMERNSAYHIKNWLVEKAGTAREEWRWLKEIHTSGCWVRWVSEWLVCKREDFDISYPSKNWLQWHFCNSNAVETETQGLVSLRSQWKTMSQKQGRQHASNNTWDWSSASTHMCIPTCTNLCAPIYTWTCTPSHIKRHTNADFLRRSISRCPLCIALL